MRTAATIVFFFFFSLTTAQDSLRKHIISVESIGAGGFFSFYYDYTFRHSSRGFFDAKAGIGTFSFHTVSLAFPHGATYNFRVLNHSFLEAGLTGSAVFRRDGPIDRNYYLIGPVVGYRRISAKGFQFRIQVTYLFTTEDYFHNLLIWPLPVIGLGKVIGKR